MLKNSRPIWFLSHLVARCKGIFNNEREIFFIMKAKGFTLNNFDFIINSLTCNFFGDEPEKKEAYFSGNN
jgi:hypothetical protein